MNPDLILQACLSNRFSEATVVYWAEWLTAKSATPPDLDSFIEFIAVMESDVADGLDALIPSKWYPNEP
jgi:hypothetical protein